MTATLMQAASLVDLVHERLWTTIVSTPGIGGTVFTEVGIAAEFQIARPTAKAVVERLVGEGLLIREGRRGARVPTITEADVRDIYRNRLLLERDADVRLAELKYVPIKARLANQEMQMHAAAEDASQVVACDIAFHRSLVEAAGSARQSRLHALIMSEAHLCMGQVAAHRLLAVKTSLNEHAGILEAISKGAVDRAGTLTEEHLQRGQESLLLGMRHLQPAQEEGA